MRKANEPREVNYINILLFPSSLAHTSPTPAHSLSPPLHLIKPVCTCRQSTPGYRLNSSPVVKTKVADNTLNIVLYLVR